MDPVIYWQKKLLHGLYGLLQNLPAHPKKTLVTKLIILSGRMENRETQNSWLILDMLHKDIAG